MAGTIHSFCVMPYIDQEGPFLLCVDTIRKCLHLQRRDRKVMSVPGDYRLKLMEWMHRWVRMEERFALLPDFVCAQAVYYSLEFVKGDLKEDTWLDKLARIEKYHKLSVITRGRRCPKCKKVQCYKDSNSEGMSEDSSSSEEWSSEN